MKLGWETANQSGKVSLQHPSSCFIHLAASPTPSSLLWAEHERIFTHTSNIALYPEELP